MKHSTSAYGNFLSVTGVIVMLISAFVPWLSIERGWHIITSEINETYSLLTISRVYNDMELVVKDGLTYVCLIMLSVFAVTAMVLNLFTALTRASGANVSEALNVLAIVLDVLVVFLFYISMMHLRTIISDGTISLNGSSVGSGYGIYIFCMGVVMKFAGKELQQ